MIKSSPGAPPSLRGGSYSKSPALGHSIPKAIPRRPSQIKAATPTSLFLASKSQGSSSVPASGGFESSDDDYAKTTDIISEHLVQPADASAQAGASFGSASHGLQGGAITRDIYKWQESRDKQPTMRPRSNSQPELLLATSPTVPNARELREPGGFRRHFLTNKAKREGKKPPNFLTVNFIDFLVLYGFYGGDVYPSDDEDEDEFDILPSALPVAGLSRRPNMDTEDEGENAPLLQRQSSGTVAHGPSVEGTSESKAFFMLVKAFVGTGVLFLPKAFSDGGLIFSLVCLLFIGYVTKHCMILLVETSRAFGGKSFGDLGQIIYGERMKQLVLASIAVSQMGFCCAYFIFVAQNLRDLLMIVSNCRFILPDWFFISLQLVLYIPLAWVRKIKNFGITSLIADVFILAGLGYIFVYDLAVISESGAQNVPWVNMQQFPLFIGTAMFAFEGICLMLPIAESMKEPAKFNKVLDLGMLFIGFCFLSIGALGYLALGDKVETIVFLNLPKTPAVTALQFFYAISIMLSFPLCIYPAIRITEQAIFGLSTGKGSFLIKWEKNLYRAALTSMLGLVAWAGSANLDKVVSLVGCFACIPLSFIYPALFHTHITENKWVRMKDWFIVVFALLPALHAHSDVILKDQTGSGKTLGLVLGVLAKKHPKLFSLRDTEQFGREAREFAQRRAKRHYLETVFVVPTRELALQIYHWTLELAGTGRESRHSLIQCVIGGESVSEQNRLLTTTTPRILVGTPTRLWDLYSSKALDVSRLQTLIVDEVDKIVEPLSRYATVKSRYNRHVHTPVGERLVDAIVQARKPLAVKRLGVGGAPDAAKRKRLQLIAASATVNNPLKALLKRKGWMKAPVVLDLNTTLPSTVKHVAYYLNEQQLLVPVTKAEVEATDASQPLPIDKDHETMDFELVAEAIASLCHQHGVKKALVFSETSASLLPLIEQLQMLGLRADHLASAHNYNAAESEPAKPFHELKDKTPALIVARDFESRGLDIPDLSHVLLIGSYSPQSYIHASGRTGRNNDISK
ncbi:neutral amino acid transporter [Kappamyces sp. JEL0680]|nr:neutral amino acid transporter [Kappamyces sp. JEL0680]